jgi:ribosomal protein L37AE/L43A
MNSTISELYNKYINDPTYPQQFPELGVPPFGSFISPNMNMVNNNQIYGTMTCYNCLSILLIRHDWNYARCDQCQKINKIPHKVVNSDSLYNKLNYDYEEEDTEELIGDVPYVYGVVNCPFCTTENKIRKEAKRVTCYHCFNSFNVNGFSKSKYKMNLSKSMGSLPSIIKYREIIPVYNHNNCNCHNNFAQLFLMDKILQTIKEKRRPIISNPTLIADPYGFYFRDLIDDYNYFNRNNNNIKIIEHIPQITHKKKEENESDGFKITIRKKNKDKKNDDNKLSKSAVFEKVFYTNKSNNRYNYNI